MNLDNQGRNIDLFIQFAEKSLILTANGDKDEVKVNHDSEIREQIDWIRQKVLSKYLENELVSSLQSIRQRS
jgi:hypothetical protein